MATVSKDAAERIIKAGGYYLDDPRVVRVVRYIDQAGAVAYAVLYENEDLSRYHNSPYCRDVQTLWEADRTATENRMTEEKPDATIFVESLVSARDGEPYVKLTWNKEIGQLTPEEARQHAFRILAAADAAESDHFVFSFLTSRIGADKESAGAVLGDFRRYREEREKKDVH